MTCNWRKVRLKDLISIKHGYAFKGEFMVDFQTNEVLVTPGNFAIGGGFKYGKLKYYQGDIPEKYILSPDDLVVTMTDLSKAGDTLGYSALIPHDGNTYLHNQRIGLIEDIDPNILDKKFLYFLMRSPSYRQEVLASSTGTSVKHTSPTKILDYEFMLPSLDEQRLIGNTLFVLEEKIANNTAMNQTLEKIAQRIFKSWFIDFDPVKANAEGIPFNGLSPEIQALFPSEFEESELGLIPKGWEVTSVANFSINHRKNVNKENIDPDMAYLGLEHINRKNLSITDYGTGSDIDSNKSEFQKGDILLGKLRPYFHKVGLPVKHGVCSTDILVIRPNDDYLFEYVTNIVYQENLIAHLTSCSSGTRMPRAKWQDVEQYKIAAPKDHSVIKEFSRITKSLYERMALNCIGNSDLTKVRERLLPRLISGKIIFSDENQELKETA